MIVYVDTVDLGKLVDRSMAVIGGGAAGAGSSVPTGGLISAGPRRHRGMNGRGPRPVLETFGGCNAWPALSFWFCPQATGGSEITHAR